ncbi:MAG: hypothetical protein ACD_37C00665G0005 [uncultured bacterium]|nr:MAG: hypothetical protein ACD_37C00665G0005 [uncultured bacterium]KKQ96503.1 MAG: 30S ribosomal protein S17 [Candidatus Levybacteria bacterium GW2011_GWA1_39_11]KKR24979.1 MAG: 30S ribosomal protein S17 [Candidatus Levybacteria bacterium GW2011_GWB1_39_7]KKR27537.1 MAG: 30S ribosomal protein S17 [Microgenomates group bacterium GW2011_GWC1_39_7]KKR49829.1 MAG: 30S ribosomal protein S17 [Candidatus Levybacteria bacterium GW2011_GWA2_40_16]OGH14139.1 MAG: 30S ribosomal protein S17 [Candidatus 
MARKTLIGKVMSNKMQKTVVVEIERLVRHPIYKKILKKTKRIKANSDNLELRVGQYVRIEQTRPLSRDKHFKVVEVMKGETRD